MESWLTYSDYKTLGGKTNEANFNLLEEDARMKIDSLTFGRLRNETPMRRVVKGLIVRLIDRGLLGSTDGMDYQSQSNGSQSFSLAAKKGNEAENFIRAYLQNEVDVKGVPLFYSGNL